MRRLLAVAAGAALGLSGLVAAPSATADAGSTPLASPTAALATSSVRWGRCSDAGLRSAGAVCGMLSVPLDYGKPHGTHIRLALSMIRHTVPASKYQGIMLTNPGGPGASGLTLSVLGSYVPGSAADAYDWIGFDPRGVGSSVPSLSCDPNYLKGPRPPYVPTNVAILDAQLSRAKAYTTRCGRTGGDLLDHVTTEDSARDMDSIRAALGQKQLNYYGFSYGTYLGQVYASMFPSRVRRMVLDSNVDPRGVWYQANLDQDVAFERTMQIWFAWVATYDSVYHLGKTRAAVERLFYTEQNALQAKPAGGVVGGDEWNDIFLGAGYYQQTWLDLGDLFSQWVHHRDLPRLLGEYRSAEGVGDDNEYAMYAAVQCTDVQWPTSWARWSRDNWRIFQRAPYVTWNNAWFNAPCLTWPGAVHTPVPVNGSKVAPILLVDETLDAATPYSGSLEVRKLFPRSRLLALPGGTSHANSLFGNACEDDQIAAYLADGTLPHRKPGNGPDTTCAPLPVPNPTAPSARSQGTAKQPGAPTRADLLPTVR